MKEKKEFQHTVSVAASAPCRLDMGGTLDLSTFVYPLNHLRPCTFNLAIDYRTRVSIHPYAKGMVKITSRGFESAEYPAREAPFDHPLGLMFAVAGYFGISGVHIRIESTSPPRSALGGSSAAAVALAGACYKYTGTNLFSGFLKKKAARLAYCIEGSVAGVPCGIQDQLAAAYGGVNAWYWKGNEKGTTFKKRTFVGKPHLKELEQHTALAYCGIPHDSKDVNSRWVKGFVSSQYRSEWREIIECTHHFVEAIDSGNIADAVKAMNRELHIREEMTPDVLDDMGVRLTESALKNDCGARFTGAGGGGCIWAIGRKENIRRLKQVWKDDLSTREEAHLMDVRIDTKGLLLERRKTDCKNP